MATFIEVNSLDKMCPVIVNLDTIVEIAPLASGGCILFINDGMGTNNKQGIRVSDDYKLFKQFAMETVTAEDISRRFPTKKKEEKKSELNSSLEIPKL